MFFTHVNISNQLRPFRLKLFSTITTYKGMSALRYWHHNTYSDYYQNQSSRNSSPHKSPPFHPYKLFSYYHAKADYNNAANQFKISSIIPSKVLGVQCPSRHLSTSNEDIVATNLSTKSLSFIPLGNSPQFASPIKRNFSSII